MLVGVGRRYYLVLSNAGVRVIFCFYKNLHFQRNVFLLILNALLESVSFIVSFIIGMTKIFNLPRNSVYLECFWKCLKN